MFNPFLKFHPSFIENFRVVKRNYLVSQTFTREDNMFKDENKTYLLMSYYDDKGRAEHHKNAVKHDPLAAIIDLENEKHREKLKSILEPDSTYVVYLCFVADNDKVNDTVRKLYSEKIKKYIEYYKRWHIPKHEDVK